MNIRKYLDSTYLKTAAQAGLSEPENASVVEGFIREAIAEKFKLIMIRPDYVSLAKQMITKFDSEVAVGTVIDFPEGRSPLAKKLEEATKAIADGADELDFVCNYEAFKKGEVELLSEEIYQGTKLALDHHKIVKWIIEVAALTDVQIGRLSALIKDVAVSHFAGHEDKIFVKSSTGFYKTSGNLPNGATIHSVAIMLEHAAPLPMKAAGGIRSYEEALEMINLGVKRIGTSSAKAMANGETSSPGY